MIYDVIYKQTAPFAETIFKFPLLWKVISKNFYSRPQVVCTCQSGCWNRFPVVSLPSSSQSSVTDNGNGVASVSGSMCWTRPTSSIFFFFLFNLCSPAERNFTANVCQRSLWSHNSSTELWHNNNNNDDLLSYGKCKSNLFCSLTEKSNLSQIPPSFHRNINYLEPAIIAAASTLMGYEHWA